MKTLFKSTALALILAFTVAGCAKVGSEAWCNDLKQKPKGDWTANEATDFAKHCIFQ